MHFIDSLAGPPELGKECYYIVTDETRRDILLLRARPTDRIMTLRQFCEKGLALFSDRPVITRSKELALLSMTLSKSSFGREATTAVYRLMDELSKGFGEIEPKSAKLKELRDVIARHYSNLGWLISRTRIEQEALNLMKAGRWFPMREVYIELYPVVSAVELEAARAIGARAELTIVSPEPPEELGGGRKVSAALDHYSSFAGTDDELEFIARGIIEAHLDGIPFESMAVITPKVDYLPLIDEMLGEYSIPHTMYPYTLLKDTKIFEFVSQLVSLIRNDFRAADVINFFSSPLVEYGGVNRRSIKRIERHLTRITGGIDEIERELEKHGEQLSADLTRALREIEGSLKEGASSLLSVMVDFNIVQSITGGASHAEAKDSLRRESVAYRRVVEALRDLAWAGDMVGERVTLESVADILYNANDSVPGVGGVAVIQDKTGFWGGFQRTFYCGVDISALYPEENPVISRHETEALEALERRSSELRKRIVMANMRGEVSCVAEADFTVFDALGLYVRELTDERRSILSRADFEHALAKRPELIVHAHRFGEEYGAEIRSAGACVKSRDSYAANEYNGILGRSVELCETSPGALEDYVRCPFHCFARHILGLEDTEYEEREEVIWGRMVHEAMRELYSSGSGIDEELIALRGSPLFAVRGEEKIERVLRDPSDPCIRVRVRRALRNIFPEILKRENSASGRPVLIEHDLSKELCGLTLRGRVDRVDVEGDRLVVYDYKTSDYSSGDLSLMQLPLYLYMMDGPYGGGVYYIIRDEERDGSPVVEPRRFLDVSNVYDAVREMTKERAPAIMESMRKGFFPARSPGKHPRNCDYCEVRRACYITKRMDISFPFGEYVRRREER